MNNDLDTIMQVFDKLGHGEQVELFLKIKESLLTQRQIRIEMYQKEAEFQSSNIKALYEGNSTILNNKQSVKIEN